MEYIAHNYTVSDWTRNVSTAMKSQWTVKGSYKKRILAGTLGDIPVPENQVQRILENQES